MNKEDKPGRLKGRVAVVTGASRGAGRGIAIELGAAGATVYVTGRSTREQPAQSYGQIMSLSGLSTMRLPPKEKKPVPMPSRTWASELPTPGRPSSAALRSIRASCRVRPA